MAQMIIDYELKKSPVRSKLIDWALNSVKSISPSII